ncbi:MAG: PqqD family protein [Eubacterium sp.]|nr:PqqD family protein [Eubacterium sp.]
MTKFRSGYLLTTLANRTYLLPYGQRIATFHRGLQLNETGVLLWNALQDGISEEQLPAFLASHYDADETDLPMLTDDVTQFMQQLRALGIVDPPMPDLCSVCEAPRTFRIGTLLVELRLSDALIADEFYAFAERDMPSQPQEADLTVSLRYGQPSYHPVGQLLINNAELTILDAEDYYYLSFPASEDLVACLIDKDAKHACFYAKAETPTLCESLFHGIRFSYLLCAQTHGLYAIHSASICYESRAWLFSASSGTGKSTHAGLWNQCFQTPFLNGDLNLLGMQNHTPVVYGLPWCGTSGIYTPDTYPLGGIVFLQRAQTDAISHIPADQQQLLLSQRLISPTWTADLLQNCLDFCAQIQAHSHCFILQCTAQPSAAHVCRSTIDRLTDTDTPYGAITERKPHK